MADFVWSTHQEHIPDGADGMVSMTFVHLDVHKFTPSILKALLVEHHAARPHLPKIIFCSPLVPSALFDKFVRRFGWIRCGEDALCHDGVYRPIYCHFKDI